MNIEKYLVLNKPLKIYIYTLFIFLLTIMAFKAFPVAFEDKKPQDERSVLVPKGARPVLKEEYPMAQFVVDRIKARHRYALSIPFSRAWNTAALTFLTGVKEAFLTGAEEDPQVWNNREVGFALHSQRLRVGSLKNKEYFQRETAGFPEGRYWPLPAPNSVSQPPGYMSTTFVHLSLKQIHSKYIDYNDSDDRINGILNVMIKQNQNLSLMAQRDMQSFGTGDTDNQPKVRNTASISYKRQSINKLELYGNSIWSTLTDVTQKDFGYLSGSGFVVWGKSLSSVFDVELKARLQVSTLRDQTLKSNIETLETRKSVGLSVSNIASPASFLKLKLEIKGLYDSKYKGYATPAVELALVPKVIQMRAGFRRQAVLPDYDSLYWPSKFVMVNNELQPEEFWETYGSLNIDVITRFKLLVSGSYSRPKKRLTWEQLPDHVWMPVNKPTSEAIMGEASLRLNPIGNFNVSADFKYQKFSTSQFFDPEKIATAGISYGNSTAGSIALGACFWNFQSLENTRSPENFTFVYLRINRSLAKIFNIFVDGRYTLNREDVIYYRGMPQAGRIVSLGVNVVFGGLD